MSRKILPLGLLFFFIAGLTATVLSNANSRQQISRALPAVASIETFAPAFKPPPKSAVLPGAVWVPQTFNNCGPATVSMTLQYFGLNIGQDITKKDLRTNPDDTNVFTYEIRDYLAKNYDIQSKLFYNGDINLLKTLVANGFYVILENWLHPNEDIGHFVIIRGYDDDRGVLIADDSFIGTNVTFFYDQFDKTQWKPFNYEYLPVYKKDMEPILKAIVGNNSDAKTMYQNAVVKNRQTLDQNSNDMYAWFNLGTSYYGLEDYKNAKIAFEKARAIGWPRRMLWYQIQPVQTYNKLGEFDKALILANEGLLYNGKFNELLLEKAIALKGLGRISEAREVINQAILYAPDYGAALEFKKTL